MNDAMVLTGVHKTYQGRGISTHALRGVDLTIEPGTFTCVVGPSGHGKSTLLHLLGGLDRPCSGEVVVFGEQLHGVSDARLAEFRAKRVGFVFQFFNLLRNLTVRENVQLPMMLTGASVAEQARRADDLLASVGLSEKADARANELSGGQMQRVAIARALANEPDALLLDEPTGNLDSASEAEVLEILDLLHGSGRTIVMVTHSPDIAARAQRVVEVRDGLIAVSTTR